MAVLLSFGIFFLFTPSQSWYLQLQTEFRPAQVHALEFPLPLPAHVPLQSDNTPPPNLSAESVVVLDVGSGMFLHRQNENASLLPASTVKMMTALVVLDYFPPDQILTVGALNSWGQQLKLVEGEQLTVTDLLYALLVSSANDAAEVFTQAYPGGEPAFVRAMNDKARRFHLNNTFFANATGLDSDPDLRPLPQRSRSSAVNLATLGGLALKNSLIRQIVSTPSKQISDLTGKYHHQLVNINLLLQRPDFKGIKTGWTEEAGECLVAYAQKENHAIITVVMGSRNRFQDTEKLVDWVWGSFVWQPLAPSLSY